VPAFAAVALVGFLILEYYARYFWFFGDEFAFLADRRLADVDGLSALVRELLVPHNEHLSVLPQLWYWAADSIWGLRTYWPYVTASILVHLAVATAVWLLMRRIGGDRWIAFGLGSVFVVFGPGGENIFWGFQVGFMGAMFFGLVALLLADHDGGDLRRDVLAVVFGLLSIGSAGISVSLCVGLAVAVLLRRGPRAAVGIVGPLALVFLSWFVVFRPAEGGIPRADLSDAFFYAVNQIGGALQAIVGVPGTGAVLAVVVLVLVAWRWRGGLREGRVAAALGLIASSIALAYITGVGRAALGLDQATGSRYIYLQAALLIPVLGLLLTDLPVRRDTRRAVAGVLILLALVSSVFALRNFVRDRSALVLGIKSQLLTAADDPLILGALPDETPPNPQFVPNVTLGDLKRLDALGRLPEWAPAPEIRDGVRRTMLVSEALVPSAIYGGASPVPTGSATVEVEPVGPGCVALSPRSDGAKADFEVPSGGAIIVRNDENSAPVIGELRIGGESVPFSLPAGAPISLSPRADAVVSISVVEPIEICVPRR
jgi:hypothetical protein